MLIQQSSPEGHVERIMLWRENLEILSDDKFFNLIHIYLGEVKTPYNKQRLIEQLSTFFHKEENRQNLFTLLDNFDREIITAISLIPAATQDKILTFFSGEYTQAALCTRLLNLHDRLIIYTDYQTSPQKPHIMLNPVIEDLLLPCTNISFLLPAAGYTPTYSPDSPLSPQLIASFVSFLKEKPELCKADGSIKKNCAERLESIFPNQFPLLQQLLNSFINLSLIKQNDKYLIIDDARFKSFAELSPQKQYAYLCVGATGRLSQKTLSSQAQILLNCIFSIPKTGFTRHILLRAAYLLRTIPAADTAGKPAQNRLNRILTTTQNNPFMDENEDYSQPLFDRIIDAAALFGILAVSRTSGTDTYTPGPAFADCSSDVNSSKKVISIDAGFTITIMPGLQLSELLPLIPFLSVIQYNTAVEYEITRQSVIRSFDEGYDAEMIFSLLERYSCYELPQNLRVTVSDWQNSYQSAILYKGYILKVDEQNSKLLEKNPNSARYIQKKIAPGIYFLSIKDDSEAASFSAESGFDFIGSIKTTEKKPSETFFPLLHECRNCFQQNNATPAVSESTNDADILITELHTVLNNLNLPQLQREALSQRIDRHLILSVPQLSVSSIHSENLEADGMDYSGKLRLLENATAAGDMIEITLQDKNNASHMVTYTGIPSEIIKKDNTIILALQLNKKQELQFFPISNLNHIKWFKQL
jgi:hypothetical protein